MSNKLLELKNWNVEKVGSKMAVLRHKDGHEMHVSIKALPKLQQEQIKRVKMDDGGPVSSDAAKKLAEGMNAVSLGGKKPAPQQPAPSPQPSPKPQYYEEGGKAEPDYKQEFSDLAASDPSKLSMLNTLRAPAKTTLGDENSTAEPGASHDTHITINVPSASAQPTQAPAPSINNPNSPSLFNPDYTVNQPKALQQSVQGLGAQKEVESGVAKAAVPLEQERVKQQGEENNPAGVEDQIAQTQAIRQHVDEFRDFVNSNPIDPTHYARTRSDEQKMQTAIGLMLGGASPAALNFIQNQINNDIIAQEKNIENKKTVLGAYYDLYKDLPVAASMARASMDDQLLHSMNVARAKLGTKQAEANYLMNVSKIADDRDQHIVRAQGRYGQLLNGATPQRLAPHESGEFQAEPLLSPQADNYVQGAQYAELPNIQGITQQVTQASQIDKALKALGPAFNAMAANRTVMGRTQQQEQNLIGRDWGPFKVLAEAEPESREYQSALTTLVADLGQALKGTNLGSEELANIIKANAPVHGDSPQQMRSKFDRAVNTIKRAVPTTLIPKTLLNTP